MWKFKRIKSSSKAQGMDFVNSKSAFYAKKSIIEISRELDINPVFGLRNEDIQAHKNKWGTNNIDTREIRWWQIFLRQFKSSFIYLLFFAALIAFWLGEHVDTIIILLFIVINTLIGFYQEFRSEKAVRLLGQYLIKHVRVIRGGRESVVASSELTPGDVIILEAGDIIPADVRFFDENNLFVDETVLTGESVPVKKISEDLVHEPSDIYSALNIGFSGTKVTSGRAKAVVFAVGRDTSFGHIAELTAETQRESSFEASIKRLSRFILVLVLSTLAVIFVANLIIKGNSVGRFSELLIFAIALAVSVVPEALPLVTSFSLARGALRLAKNKVVVKRLSAIEDLGSIGVLCSDKTGTLTENKLKIAGIYSEDPEEVLPYAAMASELFEKSFKNIINPFDVAIAERISSEAQIRLGNYQKINEIPFDPKRRRNSILVNFKEKYELVVRGAPESIVEFCVNLDTEKKAAISDWIAREGFEGRRVIAVAKKECKLITKYDYSEEEKNLQFVGLISFIDPIKDSAKDAVSKAKDLGVKVKILTGDSREVAGAVGYEIGLTASPKEVITGVELDKLSSPLQHEAVEKYNVFARVTPEHKYKIIQLLKEKNEVGFLGEGINDAPALKLANVALVVQSAADIAREASDIVLLQKGLGVIVDGIKEGREVFANTIKYVKATLASNFGNFYAIAIISLFIDFLPMLPLQILLVNLLSDFPMIAIATDKVDKEELKTPKSYNIKDITLVGTTLGIVSSIFDFIFFALFYKFGATVLQTNWFIASILTELVFIFSIRTKFVFFKAQRPSKLLSGFSALAALVTVVLPFSALGQNIFKFTHPEAKNLFLIFGIIFVYFATSETVKLLYYKFSKS